METWLYFQTVFSLGLLYWYAQRAGWKRAHQFAGRMLFTAKDRTWESVVAIPVLAFMIYCAVGFFCAAHSEYEIVRQQAISSLAVSLFYVMLFFCVLTSWDSMFVKFKIHEQGMIIYCWKTWIPFFPVIPYFIHWRHIDFIQGPDKKRRFLLHCGEKTYKTPPMRREKEEEILPIIAGYAEVRTMSGAVLHSKPISSGDDETPGYIPSQPLLGRFQFGIRLLLLLMIFVASTAASFTATYRRMEEARVAEINRQKLIEECRLKNQMDALARLQPLKPTLQRNGVWVNDIAFQPHASFQIADWKAIGQLSYLRGMCLVATAVTDSDIKNIEQIKCITSLSLDNTSVSDACIDSLSAMTQLCSLSIVKTKITPEGVEKLKKALPRTVIIDK